MDGRILELLAAGLCLEGVFVGALLTADAPVRVAITGGTLVAIAFWGLFAFEEYTPDGVGG